MQDFTKRMTVVLDNNLKSWELLNTVGHLSAYLGNKLGENFATDDNFTIADGNTYKRNSQYPLIALTATQEEIKDLVKKLRTTDLIHIEYLPEMVEYIDDIKLGAKIKDKKDDEIFVMGVGIFGDNDKVKALTQQFKLWK